MGCCLHSTVSQKFVTLSVTEAEIAAGVMMAQDLLYVYHLVELIGLDINLPMLLEIDNSVAVDIANGWSVKGCTHHVDVCNYFVHELEDKEMMVIKHIPRKTNVLTSLGRM